MFPKLRLFVAAFGVFALVACVTNGNAFQSRVDWIKEGTTTQSDVKMLLGNPYSVGYSQGRPTWTYGHYKHSLFGKSSTKELKFYWQGDVVHHFSFNSSFPEDTRKVVGAKKKKKKMFSK